LSLLRNSQVEIFWSESMDNTEHGGRSNLCPLADKVPSSDGQFVKSMSFASFVQQGPVREGLHVFAKSTLSANGKEYPSQVSIQVWQETT
jgi:hypothetical protein